ncbi:Uncharacterised protein [uncultured archaeon]|nr:Uncharacterised protein [uncultured archaeon]
MDQRWIFLSRCARKKIEKFSYSLREELGDFWRFTEFVDFSPARQPLPDYSLEKCFKQKPKMRDVKLVIGQEFFDGPSIRLAFRHVNVWADYISPYSADRYSLVEGIFQKVFEVPLIDYKPQHIITTINKNPIRLIV